MAWTKIELPSERIEPRPFAGHVAFEPGAYWFANPDGCKVVSGKAKFVGSDLIVTETAVIDIGDITRVTVVDVASLQGQG